MTSRRYIDAVLGVPLPTSPISHAVVVGNTCWVSGQHALDDNGIYRPARARDEADRAFELVFKIVQAAGLLPEDIVFVEIVFADLSDLAEVNLLFEELFAVRRRPARTIHQAARLPFGAKVKVHAIAVGEVARDDL